MEQFIVDALRDSPVSLITGVIIYFAIRPGIAAMQQTLNIMLAQVQADAAKDKGENVVQQSQLTLMNTMAVGHQDVVREATSTIRALTNAVQNNNSLVTSMRAEQLSHAPFLMKIPDIVTKADGIAKQLSKTKTDLEARHNQHDRDNQMIREGVELLQTTVGQTVVNLQTIDRQLVDLLGVLKDTKDETPTPEPEQPAIAPGLESPERANDGAVVDAPASPTH